MEKHFVTFFSPGTFMAETTSKPIASWDVAKAVEMANDIVERYNATPYGFQFSTRARGTNDLDSRVSATSPMYHLGGEVFTLSQLEERNDPSENILRDNMRFNHYEKVVINTNSWKSVHPLEDGDVVLDYTPPARSEATESE